VVHCFSARGPQPVAGAQLVVTSLRDLRVPVERHVDQ
jgi:hypothetical protein